jgi:hypothetical protein
MTLVRARSVRTMRAAPARRTVSAAELDWYRLEPRHAVTEERIVCLTCGLVLRQLTNTHIRLHGMTPIEYKDRHGYNRRRPLMCHALRRLYAARAVREGPADPIRRRPIVADLALRRAAGRRRIVLEEYLTRGVIQQRPRGRWSVRDRHGRFSSDERRLTSG